MSGYKYNSWGRTRTPKNYQTASARGHYVTGGADGAAGVHLNGSNSLSGISDGVYKTENQRYLHMSCSGSNSGISNVYVYSHALPVWTELVTGSSGASHGSVVCHPGEARTVDINGVDYLLVVTSSSTKRKYQNFIAFSTF